MPNTALPSTLAGVSSRGVRVPSRRKSFGSLRGGSFVTGSWAALARSLPYVPRRLVGPCTTAPRSARHAAGSASQVDAAASISISRAAAPALRSRSHDVRIAVLPPVDMRRDHPAGFSGTGPSRTVDQSASSSSARIMARPVCEPWPISDLSTVSVTIPSEPMWIQALGENGASSMSARGERDGRWNAMTSPALVATKSRRERVELMGPPETKRCAVRGARLLPCRSIVGGRDPAIGDNRALRTAHLCSGDFSYRQLSYSLPRSRKDRVAHRGRDRGSAGLDED